MTEPTYDPIIDQEREARLRQLQQRRSPAPVAPTARTTPRKQHAAQSSRVAAAGFGLASMLALVGVMGFANRPTGASDSEAFAATDVAAFDDGTEAAASDEPRPVEVIVVIHQAPAVSEMNEAPGTQPQSGEPRVVTATKTTANSTGQTTVPVTSKTKPVVTAPTTKKTTKKKPTTKKSTTKSTKKKTKTNGSK